MDIKMHLERASKLRLQKTAFLTNYFLGEEFFRFDKHRFGSYAYSIDIISKKIGEYQKYYNLDITDETYNMLYKVLCSEKTDRRLEKINQAVEQAADYVNQIKSDKELEGITTVLYLLYAGQGCKRDEVVYGLKKWSEDKANLFLKMRLFHIWIIWRIRIWLGKIFGKITRFYSIVIGMAEKVLPCRFVKFLFGEDYEKRTVFPG